MASNFSQIADVLNNINVTFNQTNTTNIFQNAIEYSNTTSNGWSGLFIFIIMSLSVIIYIYANRQEFLIFDKFNVILISTCIILDFGIYLVLFGILNDVNVYMSIMCIYFIMCYFSLIKKDMRTQEG